MNDDSLMFFGKFKGVKLRDVPARYLIWVLENLELRPDLKYYIEDNIDVLYKEAGK